MADDIDTEQFWRLQSVDNKQMNIKITPFHYCNTKILETVKGSIEN